jgi:putative spermidine/putrescine transport system ATP-binding protein
MNVQSLARVAGGNPASDLAAAETTPAIESARHARAQSLHLAGVCKSYGSVLALDDISLTVARGEFLTLLGPSGSGKTTLLMMIAGFVAPTAGSIRAGDRDITDLAPERRNFGMVFQGYALFPHMTVGENVAYPLRVRGIGSAAMAEKVRETLALVRLPGFDARYPRQLSGGQQQRVAIARALAFAPDVLLLDEPLGALDRQLRAEVQVELKALHARLGTTFVYVTHDQDEALSMSDRVAIINHGRLVQQGDPVELYERPTTRFVAEFLGRSNIIDARIIARERGITRLETGGQAFLHRGTIAGSARALLSLRPEKIMLSATEPLDQVNRAQGAVSASVYLGATRHVLVRTDAFGGLATTCLASSALESELGPGTPVWVGWAPDATIALESDDETWTEPLNSGDLRP